METEKDKRTDGAKERDGEMGKTDRQMERAKDRHRTRETSRGMEMTGAGKRQTDKWGRERQTHRKEQVMQMDGDGERA